MLLDLQPEGRDNYAKTFHKSFSFNLWCVGGDGVEDVDEDEEEGDLKKKIKEIKKMVVGYQESHPAWDHVHRDEEGDPGDDHKQT